MTGVAQDTKEEVLRIVGSEVRGFLDKMDIVDMMQQVVSGLVIDVNAQRRLERIELETPAYSVYVTQSDEPKLIVSDEEGGLHIYDAIKLTLDQTVEDPGPGAAYFRAF